MKRVWLNLEDIDIYDEQHSNDEITDASHREHIERVKKYIKDGRKITPIAVFQNGSKYKRLDGFCRCIAHKELGMKKIEALIYDEDNPGVQHGLWVIEEWNYTLMPHIRIIEEPASGKSCGLLVRWLNTEVNLKRISYEEMEKEESAKNGD